MKRRKFIQNISLGISAIAAGCTRPEQKLVPVVRDNQSNPTDETVYYNSVFMIGNIPYGTTIKTIDTRPIKIDGNVLHPLSLGGSTSEMQSSIYNLYDPERFWEPSINSKKTSLNNVLKELSVSINNNISKNENILIYHSYSGSPTLNKLFEIITDKYPNIIFKSTLPDDLGYQEAIYNNLRELNKYEYIVDFGSDIFGNNNLSIYALKKLNEYKAINNKDLKIISFDNNPTVTNKKASLNFCYSQNEIEEIIEYLYLINKHKSKENSEFNEREKSVFDKWFGVKPINKLISIIEKYHNNVLIIGNENFSLHSKCLISEMNNILSPVSNQNIHYTNTDNITNDISMVIFANLQNYDCSSSEYEELITKTKPESIVSLSYYQNKSTLDSSFQIPLTNELESWNDYLFENIYSVNQPVIAPLNKNSISFGDLLVSIFNINDNETEQPTFYDFLRNTNKFDDEGWEKLVKDGFTYTLPQKDSIKGKNTVLTYNQQISNKQEEIYLNVYNLDKFKNDKTLKNIYLAEIPNDLSGESWGTSAILSEKLATKYNLKSGDLVELINKKSNLKVELPILIQNEVNDKSVLVVCNDIFILTDSNFLNFQKFIKLTNNQPIILKKTFKNVAQAISNNKQEFDNSNFINKVLTKNNKNELNINPGYKYLENKWAMSIDTDNCTGCNACVTSCYIENNIPIVGKEECIKNRSMSWINILKYSYKEGSRNKYLNIPLLCQHCDSAPCEAVCPVGATSHSPEGINEMTYNRCIGARFCMANCPYKVRRFNFKNNENRIKAPLELISNPLVTIRSRGVAEKCTFCIQRINESRYKAKSKGSNVFDEDIQTACQQACPADAITFGNILNKQSKIYQKSISKNNYVLLGELNTKSSITYLFKNNNENTNRI